MEKTLEEKKAFALEQIKPYYLDNSLCAVVNGQCAYYTSEGKMCVAGKNLMMPDNIIFRGKSIKKLIDAYGIEILKPEARDILTTDQWQELQNIHDAIVFKNSRTLFRQTIEESVANLGLFTMEELQS